MLQLRGSGLGLPWCSQAAVGEQCVPDGTIPACSVAPVGAQCTPDGASSPPGAFTLPAQWSSYPGSQMPPPKSSVPNNPAPTGVIITGGAPGGGAAPPGTIITQPAPGTVATVTGAMPAGGFAISQLWTTWWGLGLLALGGYAAYRYSKKPAGKAA